MGDPKDNATPKSNGNRFLQRLKTIIYAAPKNEENAVQLRVGLIGGDVPIFPPFAILLTISGGFLSWFVSGNRQRYLPKDLGSSVSLRSCLSIAMVMFGVRTVTLCEDELKKAETEANFEPVTKVCETGPYKYSRNLMYLGAMLLPTSLSVAFDTKWLLYSALGAFSYLNFIVVPAEEKLLRNGFGKAYEDYCKRVPRWFWIF